MHSEVKELSDKVSRLEALLHRLPHAAAALSQSQPQQPQQPPLPKQQQQRLPGLQLRLLASGSCASSRPPGRARRARRQPQSLCGW
jgi:hypothetical protein